MNANPDTVLFSGHSAGCYMSHRMQIIHSEVIKGAGLFTCWPYGTEYESDLPAEDLTQQSIELIESNAADGLIDDPSNLVNNAVYIWSGLQDDVTPPKG